MKGKWKPKNNCGKFAYLGELHSSNDSFQCPAIPLIEDREDVVGGMNQFNLV